MIGKGSKNPFESKGEDFSKNKGSKNPFAPVFPVPRVALDDEAKACWDLAGWIGQLSSDDYLRSFTSLLIALFHASNALSRWWLRYARAVDVHLDQIYASRQFRPVVVREIIDRQSKGHLPDGKPQWTVSAENISKGAFELMTDSDTKTLGVRHLLSAYLYRLPNGHRSRMQAWGFDPPREGSAFVRQIRDQYPGELAFWTRVHETHFGSPPVMQGLDPSATRRTSGFAADTPEGPDLLDIEDDVYAVSALICSRKVEPPLSIGLFGDWGSGKSFFIRQLQRGVAWISKQARDSGRMQKQVPFFKHVVQIEFNAWHYSGGNLWASLVQHILENLRISDKDDVNLVRERQKHLQQEMQLEQAARSVAEKRANEAEEEYKNATTVLDDLSKLHNDEIEKLKKVLAQDVLNSIQLKSETVTQLNQLRRDLGLQDVKASSSELLAALQGTHAVLRRVSAVFTQVPKSQRVPFVLASAVVLIAPPLVAVLVQHLMTKLQLEGAAVAALGGWLSTTLSASAGWLRHRTAWLNDQLAAVERLSAEMQQRLEVKRAEQKAMAATIEQRIDLAKQKIVAAQEKQRLAEERLQALKAQLDATTPASVLADFLRERAQSEDYRRHLGLPAVIRRDFERISQMISQENKELENKETLTEEEKGQDRRINRIVLYIDDLDRCPEDRVVEVLQAVHLLLAFPLFVVVVAVDARWVSRSLAKRYPGLLTQIDNGDLVMSVSAPVSTANPQDYLEKIFQIPIWVRAPDISGVRRMVRGFLGESLASAETGGSAKEANLESEMPKGQALAPQAESTVFHRTRHDPEARALEIHPQEVDYMDQLAPLLGRTPRALKRFVNVYRLFKANLRPEEQDGFLDDTDPMEPPYQIALLLLALLTSLPHASEAVLQHLIAAGRRKTSEVSLTLGKIVKELPRNDANERDETTRLEAWLEKRFGHDWEARDTSALITWAPRVARYSYQLHRI